MIRAIKLTLLRFGAVMDEQFFEDMVTQTFGAV
jgi:hypothetical protein